MTFISIQKKKKEKKKPYFNPKIVEVITKLLLSKV